jgi:hypothetical protein
MLEGQETMGGNERFDLQTPVLIVGGGPVGMLTAFDLSRHKIPCIVAEQNFETTKWPKMDLTNCRTMEILRMCGLADEVRQMEGAVGEESPFIDTYHTGLGPDGKRLTALVSPTALSCLVRVADLSSLYRL